MKNKERIKLKDCCYIKNVNGKHFLFMPDGTKIPRILWTRVYDGFEEEDLSYVIVKLYIDIK